MNDEKKLALEKEAVYLSKDIADEVEMSIRTRLKDHESGEILQPLIYAKLASWFMCCHLSVAKIQKEDRTKTKDAQINHKALIQDIVNLAMFMHTEFEPVKRVQ